MTETVTPQLKPCPFCGGAPAIGRTCSRQETGSWAREHEALGCLIKLLDDEPSIGDAEMADALEKARCAWDHSLVGSSTAPFERLEVAETALAQIANAFTAHAYSDAIDAVQALKDIAKEALNAKR